MRADFLVTSAIVSAEIEPAPQDVRDFFERHIALAEIVHVSDEAIELQQRYISTGIVTSQAEQDALRRHVPVSRGARTWHYPAATAAWHVRVSLVVVMPTEQLFWMGPPR